MSDKPNYGLLKTAYALIDGVPDRAISLNWSRPKEGPELTTDTVFHPARWLALHPTFRVRGLTLSGNGKQLLFKGRATSNSVYSEALAQLFGIPVEDAVGLFAERGTRIGESSSADSDKDVWLNRVRNYLLVKGQLNA